MARVVADLLEAVGIDHVITVDLHTPQIEGFFHAPVDSLTAVPTFCAALRDRLPADIVGGLAGCRSRRDGDPLRGTVLRRSADRAAQAARRAAPRPKSLTLSETCRAGHA